MFHCQVLAFTSAASASAATDPRPFVSHFQRGRVGVGPRLADPTAATFRGQRWRRRRKHRHQQQSVLPASRLRPATPSDARTAASEPRAAIRIIKIWTTHEKHETSEDDSRRIRKKGAKMKQKSSAIAIRIRSQSNPAFLIQKDYQL